MTVEDQSFAELEAALDGFDRARYEPRVLDRAATEWAKRGQNEHASIASFGRFSLGLLAVGAPPQLLTLTHRAALDEIVHARASFALASAYSGSFVGPGSIDIVGALDDVGELATLVESTVIEGCVGETLSALEAHESANVAVEPAARLVLARIADDEARHAELAWAFVRWAVGVAPSLLEGVSQCFQSSLERATASVPDARCFEPELATFGFLTRDQVRALRHDAVTRVLTPAAASITG